MSARHVILGLIREQPSHTYDIVVRFDRRLKPWNVNRGQVYRTVTTLEREGLIEAVGPADPDSKAGPAYRLTPSGASELRRWFQIPHEEVEPLRGEILAKLAVAGPDEASTLLPLLDWYERAIAQGIEDGVAERRDGARSQSGDDWTRAVDAIVADAALLHNDAELQWVRRAREFVKEFAGRQFDSASQGRSGPLQGEAQRRA